MSNNIIILKRITNFSKIFSKLIVASLILASTFLVNNNLLNLTARAAENVKFYDNPEAVLIVQLKQGTNLQSILNNFKNKNSNEYSIISFSGKVDINNQVFPVNLLGQYSIKDIKNEYNKQVEKFLNKLEKIKEISDFNPQSIENLETKDKQKLDKNTSQQLQTVINKVSTKEVKNSKNKNFWDNLVDNRIVSNMTLAANSKVILENVRNDLIEVTKEASLITRGEIEAQVEKYKKDSKILEKKLKEPNSNKVNLVEISQGKIEDVDKYVKTEINGNKFVIDSDLNKAELNLSKEEKQTIKSLINQYNFIPEAQKNDISDILENLNLETKSNLTEQIGFIFKGIISGVEVSADCQQSNWRSYFWWGVRDNMNKCSANYLSYNWGGMWSWATNLMAFACIAAGYFGALAGLVCGGVLAVMQYYSRLSADLDWLADRCNRVRVDFTWYVQYSSGCI